MAQMEYKCHETLGFRRRHVKRDNIPKYTLPLQRQLNKQDWVQSLLLVVEIQVRREVLAHGPTPRLVAVTEKDSLLSILPALKNRPFFWLIILICLLSLVSLRTLLGITPLVPWSVGYSICLS